MLDKPAAERPTVTQLLAAEMAAIEFDELPRAVVDRVKALLLDSLGNIISGSRERPAQVLARVLARWGCEGDASAVATRQMLPAPLAGFINGVSAHSGELAAARNGTASDIGSVIVPASLAMGEANAADGKKLIAAIVAGYETTMRIDQALNPGRRTQGYHVIATVGVFGAAVSAGKLLGLDGGQFAHALGVAGIQALCPVAFQGDRSMVRQIMIGKSVHDGLLAAALVREGLTGPVDVLDSPEGFGRAAANGLHLDELIRGLSHEYRILDAESTAARDVQDKWHGKVDSVIGGRRAQKISQMVAECEQLPIIDVLTAILAQH